MVNSFDCIDEELVDYEKPDNSESNQQLSEIFQSLEYIEDMDYEKVDDRASRQRLSEIYWSLEKEVFGYQKMHESSFNQQQLDPIQSLKDEVMDCEKVDDAALTQQLSENYQSFKNQVSDNQKMHESSLNQQQRDLIQLEDKVKDNEKVDDSASRQQLSESYQSFENKVPDSQEMHKSALNQQQLDCIQLLEDEGLVNRNFRICYLLKEERGPSFFQNLMPTFLRDARAVMQDLAKALESSDVNFDVLNARCLKLKGSSACIGACNISNACAVFIRAADKKSKAECLQALRNIKKEYLDFRRKSSSIMEFEKELLSAKKQKVMIG